MNKLIVMCGLQCSGKSTFAKLLKQNIERVDEKDVIIVSSDNIRKEHPELTDNNKVFKKVYADINYWLRQGCDVILDATNITIKSRKQMFDNVHEPCEKKCLIMNTDYKECLKRLEQRNLDPDSHKVPVEVLKKYRESFQIPFYEEGWDNIQILNKISLEETEAYLKDISQKCRNFNQNNKHHTQLLGNHLCTVGDYLSEKTDNEFLIQAGYYHDIGKLFTQLYKPGDNNAHYYNHENVGTYELLCHCSYYSSLLGGASACGFVNDDTLEWLFYINYHMEFNNIRTEKSYNKRFKIFGKEKMDNLKLFNEADKYRG